ncbi:MAG: acyl-CoA dehydrogenase family protein [Spirochaetes bacterium]|nr:acyl-CoA dehydrogenase family protein [Spirochaetota bacterium]
MKEKKPTITILDWLFSRQGAIDTRPLERVSDWKKIYDDAASGWDLPVDRAVIGGFLADRAAYAFAAGYESGLRRLVPSLPQKAIVSFCVSEEKGGHPSTIRSSLREAASGGGWTLDGSKKFITMADEAELLLVAASTGSGPDGKNRIRMVMVERNAPGVEVTVMKGLPFVPEISHGTIAFSGVAVDEGSVLPGDGYNGYIRPFRTIEDLHVFAAIAGFIFRIASLHGWPRAIREETASLIAGTRALAMEDTSSPAVHIALGGLHRQITALLGSVSGYWDMVDEQTRVRWERDRGLLSVAETARAKRLEAAWSRLG